MLGEFMKKFVISAILFVSLCACSEKTLQPKANAAEPVQQVEPVESLYDVVMWTMEQPKCQGSKSTLPSQAQRVVRARQIDRILTQIGGSRHVQESFIALMCKESQYRISVKSPAGAVGIAQLMPATAQAEADKAGLGKLSPEDLNDPEINIMLGYQHFKGLADMYKGNVARAYAAYNGGSAGATVTSMIKGGGRGVHETDDYVAQLFDMQEQRRIARESKLLTSM
jgi:hypothetical protein